MSIRHLSRMVWFVIFGLWLSAATAGSAQAADELPRYVVYYNSNATPLSAAADTAYTHVIVSFLTLTTDDEGTLQLVTPEKMTGQWESVTALKKAGKKVMVSFGGGDMKQDQYVPAVGHEDKLAMLLARFVIDQGLDGVDIDFEVSEALKLPLPQNTFDGRGFLIRLTRALRTRLPGDRYLISHAPQPPYLDPHWHGGAYIEVLKEAGPAIDWIAVQYYDNPDFEEPPVTKIVGESTEPFLTSYHGIVDGRLGIPWPSTKLLVGKPIYKDDASSGHLSPQTLANRLIKPLRQHYGTKFGGLMGWQFSTQTPDHQYWNKEMGQVLWLPESP